MEYSNCISRNMISNCELYLSPDHNEWTVITLIASLHRRLVVSCTLLLSFWHFCSESKLLKSLIGCWMTAIYPSKATPHVETNLLVLGYSEAQIKMTICFSLAGLINFAHDYKSSCKSYKATPIRSDWFFSHFCHFI